MITLVLIFSLFALVLLLWKWKISSEMEDGTVLPDNLLSDSLGTMCPLCGEHLAQGVRVRSIVYPGKDYDFMQIYGCPSCWVDAGSENETLKKNTPICLYCKQELRDNDFVMARMYRNTGERIQVRIYGCTRCKTGRF